MFVSMWMTKEVITATPDTLLIDIARTMADKRFRRMPVVAPTGQLLGLVSWHDVLHAFPANINPFTFIASEQPGIPPPHTTAAEVMVLEPLTTTPETPIEDVAHLMCERKIGALLVMRGEELAGVITESDVFRAFANIFDPGTHGVRITFDNAGGTDVFPLVAEVTHRHRLRVMSFVSMHKHTRPLCVLQVTGSAAGIDGMLSDIWKSHHQVVSVIHLEAADDSK